MTKLKNDLPDPEGGDQTPKARGGAAENDVSKDLTLDQAGGLFGDQKEGKAAGEEKTSGERKR
jgi:hypothetical protein